MFSHAPAAGATDMPFRRSTRRVSAAGALLISAGIAAGCSGGTSPAVESVQEVATTGATSPPTTKVAVPDAIEMRLVIDGKPQDDSALVDGSIGSDPFGRFASCSGLRTSFGAYQVLISGSEVFGGSVQVNSASNPHQEGTVSASARLETEASVIEVDGTLDLADTFRGGRFLGTTDDGARVVIEFDCTSPRSPAPIDRTRPYVDVAMLMVKDQQRRVLSFGLMTACADKGIDAEIAAADGPVGGLSKVLIKPDKLELYVSGQQLDLADSSVSPRTDVAGTFSATTADGVMITGAYSCRS